MGQHNYISREVIIITDLRNQIDCLQLNHSKLKTPLEGNFKAIKAWQTTLKIMYSPCSSRRTWWLGHQNASSAHVYPSRAWSLQMLTQQAWAEFRLLRVHSQGRGWGGCPEGWRDSWRSVASLHRRRECGPLFSLRLWSLLSHWPSHFLRATRAYIRNRAK